MADAITYNGVTLTSAHVAMAEPARQWQRDAFPSGNGEIAQDLGTRSAEITINFIIRDLGGTVHRPSMATIKGLDDGAEHDLIIPGPGTISHVIIEKIDYPEFMTYPNPTNSASTLKAAKCSILFRRLL